MILQNINPRKLHNELIEAGIVPTSVRHTAEESEHIAETTEINFEETVDLGVVQSVINEHDPSPLPIKPSEKERLEALEQAVLEIVLGGS